MTRSDNTAKRLRPYAVAGLSRREHIIGVVVSDTASDTRIAAESEIANSRNSRPTMPPINRIGMNTAISERLIDTTVKPTSRAPISAASRGAIPCSMWRETFSSTTIASSTTNPVATVSAISDRLLRLNPARYMTPNVPISDTGTATLGISAARTLRRNRNTTRITSATAMTSVRSTSRSEARMPGVRSIITFMSIAAGIDALDLRQFLREHRRGRVVDLPARHRVGRERDDHDRRVGGIHLPIRRIIRKPRRQQTARRVDRRLHIARRAVDVAIQVELQRDARGPQRGRRRYLGDAGDAAQCALERRCDSGGHRFGTCARQARLHGNRRKVDLRQRRDRKQTECDRPGERDAKRQQRRRDGAVDERL